MTVLVSTFYTLFLGDGWEDVSSSESSCDDVTDDVISDVTTEEPMEASSNGEVKVAVLDVL